MSTKVRSHRTVLTLAAAAAATLATTQFASAQLQPVNTWTDATGDNLWATDGNWSAGSAPRIDNSIGRADDVFFNGSSALTVVLPTSPVAGDVHFQNTAGMTITGNSGGNGFALRAGITMDSGAAAVSIPGSMNLNGTGQSYVNNSTNLLTIGSNVSNLGNTSNIQFTVDGSGPITITGGLNNSSGATTNLVKNGSGIFQLSNSTFIGNVTMNSGVMQLRGSNALGTASKTVTFNGGTIAAVNSTRTIPSAVQWVLGGDVGFGGFGSNLEIDGPLNLGGATRTIDVGTTGAGAGTVSFVGAITNGGIIKTGPNNFTSNSLSTYTGGTTVNGGALQWVNTSNIAADGSAITSGPFGTGSVTLNDTAILRSNGATDRNLQNNVVVNGNVTLGDATTQTGALTFNSTDGTHTLTTPSTFNLGTTPTLNTLVPVTIANPVTGGSLTKAGATTLTLSAANTYSGGTTVNAGTIVAAHGNALGTGALTVNDTAAVQAQASLPTALSVGPITTSGSGHLDITNNSMVVHGTGPADYASVRAQIVSGFNGGAWNGPGINSSTAAADANGLTAIGYASNADYGATDFHGVSGLTANDVLVRYTYYGDADLSGDVTLDDFSQFLNGYQTQSAATNNWLNGDFDYDGAVTLDDFSQFLFGYQHQGAPLGALESMIESSSLSAADKATMLSAVEAVPEPTGLALLGLAGAGLLARRKRRTA